ncbi:MAG: tetratricopeptide repeat protein [candidate division Zixibacteria bacterium]
MDGYRLKSKVAIDEREFLIQTVNDEEKNAVVSSLFVDGKVIETCDFPHPENKTIADIEGLVISAHEEKKTEIEHLLATFGKVAGSNDPDLMFNVGTAFYCKKLYEEAQILFESVIACRPDHYQAGNYYGLTLMALGQFEKAVMALGRVVELKPGFADFHNNYGEALLESGSCRRAIEEFEAALKINIYYADAYFNIGIAYLSNAVTHENYEFFEYMLANIKDSLNRAIMITPAFKTSRYDETINLIETGEYAQALILLKAVRDIKKEKSRQEFSSCYLRFLLFSEKVNERAVADRIQYLQSILEKNPNYSDLHHELALCHLQQAQISWNKGIKHFGEALNINAHLTKSEKSRKQAESFAEQLKETLINIARFENE